MEQPIKSSWLDSLNFPPVVAANSQPAHAAEAAFWNVLRADIAGEVQKHCYIGLQK